MSGSGKTTAARRAGADSACRSTRWTRSPSGLATWSLPRLIRRSVVRTATNAEVFGGNRETLREWLNPDHPVWSAASTFRERREYLFDRTATSPHCRTVRFTAQREFEHWYELL